jgi:FAD synthase
VALGVFDGLHIGHRAVLAAACGVVDDDGAILTATALSMTAREPNAKNTLKRAWQI